MSAPFLFLAIPCYGGRVHIEHLDAVLRLVEACEGKGIGCHVELLEDDRAIPRARARLATRFLAHPQASHLFFIDADVAFAPDAAFRLLAAEKDLVGGVYPIKHLDWARIREKALAGARDLQAAALTYVVRFLPSPTNAVEVEGGFAKVAAVGGGFMLVRRAVVEQVVAAHPELTAEIEGEGPVSLVFEPLIEAENGDYLSEDYAFCRRWRDLGGEVWADAESRLTHVGHARHSGSLVEALKPA